MEVATNPNKTNTFPNSLSYIFYKSILLFIIAKEICYCTLLNYLIISISMIFKKVTFEKLIPKFVIKLI